MRTLFYLFLVSLLFGGCQKVLDLNLNSKDPLIVIEGEISDDTLIPQTVKITKSVNFTENNSFPTVSGALVTVNDNLGNTVTLNEVSPGVYQNTTLHGYSGRTYYLSVIAEGKTYSSVCTMPSKVPLDTILIGNSSGLSSSKAAIPVFHDPAGRGNYYRFKLYDDSKVSTSILLIDDQIIDGFINNRPLSAPDITIRTNDTIQIKMMCVDKAVYQYLKDLNNNGGGPNGSATPANPTSNINGATLGYFSAQTVQIKKVIAQ